MTQAEKKEAQRALNTFLAGQHLEVALGIQRDARNSQRGAEHLASCRATSESAARFESDLIGS